MNLGKRIRKFIATKIFDPVENINLEDVVGWRSLGGSSAYGFYKDNQYENGFSSISKLSNGFAVVEQYAIDKKSKPVGSNILDRLYTPNTDMSAYDFREALAVCFLVHDKVRLRVHHKGDNINADSITGFTFMENYSERVAGGKRDYMMSNGDILEDDEVITIKSVNPMKITDGFSASRAAKRWTRLDDYIADYQRGFFENGAVPSGEMIVTAKTKTEFNDIVDTLQAKHRGATKNNNIVYSHRPTDENGKPMNSQIEWIPFAVTNKELSLKELFEQVNKKIDSAYGVPASIRAVNDANTYASIRVDEVIFVKYALSPMTLKIWSKFNHELNRITGGTGIAITYELEIPTIADEEKVKAEAKQVEATTVATLTSQGYTIESATEFVKTGNLDVLRLNKIPVEEKPEVLDADEAKDTPEQPIDMYAKSVEELTEKVDKFIADAKNKNEKPISAKKLSETTRIKYEDKLYNAVDNRMTSQIKNVIDNFGDVSKEISFDNPLEPDEDKLMTSEMVAVLFPLIEDQGPIEHSINTKLVLDAGIDTQNIEPFRMTFAQQEVYRGYVDKVARGYNSETGNKIRNVITVGREQGQSVAEIKQGLSNLIDEKYRVTRLAVSEVNRGGNESSLMSMKNIVADTGASVEKVWVHDGSDSPCEFCQAMIGTTVPLSNDFVAMNDTVIGVDGGQYLNNFVPIQVAELHPNGHCRQVYRVVKSFISEKQQAKELELDKKLKNSEKKNKKLSTELEDEKEYSSKLESILDGKE